MVQGTNPTEGRQKSAKTIIIMLRRMQREEYIAWLPLYRDNSISLSILQSTIGLLFLWCVCHRKSNIYNDNIMICRHLKTGGALLDRPENMSQQTDQFDSTNLPISNRLPPVEMVNNPSSADALEGENTDRTQKERTKKRRRKTKERVIQLMYRTMHQFNRHHLIMPFNYRYVRISSHLFLVIFKGGRSVRSDVL